jgi:hypothetical protein
MGFWSIDTLVAMAEIVGYLKRFSEGIYSKILCIEEVLGGMERGACLGKMMCNVSLG